MVGLPVYKLLGGAVRDEIQFYATGARPDLAKEMGFIGGKMPTHWGPHDGDAGIRKDAAMVADMREKCGEDFWLMLLLDESGRELCHQTGPRLRAL